MIIVKRKSDNVVLFSFPDDADVSIGDGMIVRHDHRKVLRAHFINSGAHDVVSGVALPDDWVGGAYAYDGAWHVTDRDRILSHQSILADERAARLAVSRHMVNQERNRRIALPFEFNGVKFSFDAESKARVTGAATLAGFAIGGGSGAGNYRWHGGDTDFMWIADDNSLVRMDAPTCFAFGQTAARHETAHIFAAKALKDAAETPHDFTDDKYWP